MSAKVQTESKHVVGFNPTNPAQLASDTNAVVRMLIDANAETGDRKARGITNARTIASMILSDCERDSELAKHARGTRVGVEVETKLRGERTISVQSVPILDVLRAIVFGGNVCGSGKLVTK